MNAVDFRVVGNRFGCVAKTGGSLVKVAKVPSAISHRHPIHEPQTTIQMAPLPIRHHPVVRSMVLALPTQLP